MNKPLSTLIPTKRELDKLVLNYLIIEGYKEAADLFSTSIQESASCNHQSSYGEITIRTTLRRTILTGDIPAAINALNDHDPELLDRRSDLHFTLRLHQLLELIHLTVTTNGDMVQPVTFARQQVAPLVNGVPERIASFQRVMALLLLPARAWSEKAGEGVPGQWRPVLDVVGQRAGVAGAVNAALLEASGLEAESLLPRLLKLQQLDT